MNRYELREEIGHGTFGHVFAAVKKDDDDNQHLVSELMTTRFVNGCWLRHVSWMHLYSTPSSV
jgi:hypothetical protein